MYYNQNNSQLSWLFCHDHQFVFDVFVSCSQRISLFDCIVAAAATAVVAFVVVIVVTHTHFVYAFAYTFLCDHIYAVPFRLFFSLYGVILLLCIIDSLSRKNKKSHKIYFAYYHVDSSVRFCLLQIKSLQLLLPVFCFALFFYHLFYAIQCTFYTDNCYNFGANINFFFSLLFLLSQANVVYICMCGGSLFPNGEKSGELMKRLVWKKKH